MQENKYLNPNDYILQCDYEDDDWLIFSNEEADSRWGHEGFHIGLTENNFNRLLTNLEKGNVVKIEFVETEKKYHSGYILLSFSGNTVDGVSAQNYRVPIDVTLFRGPEGEQVIENMDTITQIGQLMRVLYTQEHPTMVEQTPVPVFDDQFSYQKNAIIKKLSDMTEDLVWFQDKYGSDWGYMKTSAHHVMMGTIQGIIDNLKEDKKEE